MIVGRGSLFSVEPGPTVNNQGTIIGTTGDGRLATDRGMHELSIAVSIVDIAEQEAARRGVRVQAVHLRLGPLAGVVKEALLSAYELASENTPLAGTTLVVEDVPIVVYCPRCDQRRALNSYDFRCPECQTPTPDVVQGRELEIFALELGDAA